MEKNVHEKIYKLLSAVHGLEDNCPLMDGKTLARKRPTRLIWNEQADLFSK